MNPLDKEELSEILKIIKNDMPKHTDDTVKIKRSFSQGMPKSIMDYSAKVDNKFLNSNLAIIEEINYKNSNHWIPKAFQEYQNKIYGNSEILNHDNFFKAKLHDSFFKYQDEYGMPKNTQYMRGTNIQNVGFLGSLTNKVNGADIESGTGATLTGAGANGSIEISKADTLGTIGQYYDRIAHSIITASGNHRLGVYSDLAGEPDVLLGQTGSNVSTTGYNLESVTEFSLTTTQVWFAETADNGVETWYYKTGFASGSVKYKSATYGSLANPAGTGYTNDTYKHLMKISHS